MPCEMYGIKQPTSTNQLKSFARMIAVCEFIQSMEIVIAGMSRNLEG